jgi:hypothetical protein
VIVLVAGDLKSVRPVSSGGFPRRRRRYQSVNTPYVAGSGILVVASLAYSPRLCLLHGCRRQ